MLMDNLVHACAASNHCAETFLKQAHVIYEGSEGISTTPALMERIKTISASLAGAYYDIREQTYEMQSLLSEGQHRGRAIHYRLSQLLEWLKEDVAALTELNADIARLIATIPAESEASMLMSAATQEVMAAYDGLLDAVKALPPFELLPVESVCYPDSVFRAVNTAYVPPTGEQKENIERTHAFLKNLFPQWYV